MRLFDLTESQLRLLFFPPQTSHVSVPKCLLSPGKGLKLDVKLTVDNSMISWAETLILV